MGDLGEVTEGQGYAKRKTHKLGSIQDKNNLRARKKREAHFFSSADLSLSICVCILSFVCVWWVCGCLFMSVCMALTLRRRLREKIMFNVKEDG